MFFYFAFLNAFGRWAVVIYSSTPERRFLQRFTIAPFLQNLSSTDGSFGVFVGDGAPTSRKKIIKPKSAMRIFTETAQQRCDM